MRRGRSVKGFWSRRGVRARSTIAAVLVVAVALIGGGITLVVVLRVALTNSVEQSVQQRARDVAAQIADEDIEAATPTIDAAPGDGTLVQIVNSTGTVVASSPSITGEPAIPVTAPDGSEPTTSQVQLPFVDNDAYLVAVVAVQAKDEVVTVITAQSLVQVQKVYTLVGWLLVLGSPFLLAAVGVVTWVAVGRSLRSVDRIRDRVEMIGASDLHERVPVPVAKDEIAALATTMNHMLGRLEASASTQRRFIADASHELRSPLTSMRTSLDVAQSIGGGDAWVEAEPVLSDEVDRMTRLVGDLLLLARADEGAIPLHRVDVDLDDLVASEARRLRAQTDLTITTHIEPIQVVADPERLAQALRNLVDNAVRFASHEIQLGVSATNAGALMSVDDDGPGIPADGRVSVLDRFVRLDDHRARDHGGAGLGLAIASEIAHLHGGRIEIGSSSLGGAQVSVLLPIVDRDAPTGSRR
ncbi:MAG: HAMP domain-containing sensor histidine kinase [Actinomycetes bacterium]